MLKIWANQILFFFLAFIMVQGVFYSEISFAVQNRSLPLGTMFPFVLYPSDLYLFPLLLLSGIMFAFTYNRYKRPSMIAINAHYKIRERKILFTCWLIINFSWIFLGYFYHNIHMTSAIRVYLFWPLIAVCVYQVARLADLKYIFKWAVKFSLVIAIYTGIANILNFAGYKIIPISSTYASTALLLPYLFILSQMLISPYRSRRYTTYLSILSIGIISGLSKPVIFSYLICNLLAFLLINKKKHLKLLIFKNIPRFVIPITLLFFILQFTGGFDRAIKYVQDKYFKQSSVEQDLSGGRKEIWLQGIERWCERPLIGHGMGYEITDIYMFDGRTGAYNYIDVLFIHNYILEMLIKTGIVGTFVILIIIIRWILIIIKSRIDWPNMWASGCHYGMVLYAIGILIMSMYGNQLAAPTSAFLFWFCLGIETALIMQNKNKLARAQQ